MPAMGEWRFARGHSPGKLSICARISGEALSRNQDSPSPLTAIDSCVRGRTTRRPARAPRGSCRSRSSTAGTRRPRRNRGRGLARPLRAAYCGPLAPNGVGRVVIGLASAVSAAATGPQGSRSPKSLW